MHLVPDSVLKKENATWYRDIQYRHCFVYPYIAGTDLLPVRTENKRNFFISIEMRGNEYLSAAVYSLTQSGLTRVLNTIGPLGGTPASRKELGQKRKLRTQALDTQDYRFAPKLGVYKNIIALGQDVEDGTVVGTIHY